jgi:hypothetical protein
MPDFRAYIVGPKGKFIGVHEIVASSRDEAVADAIKRLDGHALELWEGNEYIGTLSPSRNGDLPIFKRPSRTQKV